jgi:hypothetical protein
MNGGCAGRNVRIFSFANPGRRAPSKKSGEPPGADRLQDKFAFEGSEVAEDGAFDLNSRMTGDHSRDEYATRR